MEINLTSSTILSYRDLMRTIQGRLYTSWGIDKIRFTSAYPKKTESDNIVPPIITYSIISKSPGAFGKNTNEIKPRHRETLKVKEGDKDILIDLQGQMFDYKVLFEVWAEDGDSADELAERFQQFMFQYTGYFKKAGVVEVIFEGIESGGTGTQWKTDLIKRSVIYLIRLDEVSGARCPAIEEITINTLMHETAYNMVLNLYLLDKDATREALYQEQSIITSDDDS